MWAGIAIGVLGTIVVEAIVAVVLVLKYGEGWGD
jgi:hypothetical protein